MNPKVSAGATRAKSPRRARLNAVRAMTPGRVSRPQPFLVHALCLRSRKTKH